METRNRAVFLVLRRMRAPLLALILAYTVSILGLVLIPGVDAAGRPWRMDFFHAFYVVSYTVTTIGFGELPYAFSDAQRLWITVAMYLGVVAWLYSIGTIIRVMQDPGLRQLRRETRFAAAVRRLASPFYIVCGYGDTGSLVVREMIDHGLQAVVLDIDPDRITELSFEDLPTYVPGLCADAADTRSLLQAGLHHPQCAGVVSVTNRDPVNLKVAITVKLLRHGLRTICRAESHDTQANMESFGTDAVINPFDAFADRLAMAVHAPDLHLLIDCLTQPPGRPLPRRTRPPRGKWVLCGYGRFGKAVSRYFDYEGIETVIVEKDPERTGVPAGSIHGRGTEAVTLREAHIEQAVGIVAGTDDDANNLSIVMTARELNHNLYVVTRQNARENDAIFAAARIDLVMQRAGSLANRILAIISTELLISFLHEARHQNEDWARQLVERLWSMAGNVTPDLWTVEICAGHTEALQEVLARGETVTLETLLADPADRSQRLNCLVLLHERDGKPRLTPDENMALATGDRILACGRPGTERRMLRTLRDPAALHYVRTGSWRSESAVWRWLRPRTPAA